ncbi:hypothetical protein BASA81_004490 [Batrachochytrium salamandrivorans]|nr:hypothetical protein BASA81_004490 [Batrachochytrium salamandrivorans]
MAKSREEEAHRFVQRHPNPQALRLQLQRAFIHQHNLELQATIARMRAEGATNLEIRQAWLQRRSQLYVFQQPVRRQ